MSDASTYDSNAKSSGNGYGKRTLKRMEFVYGTTDITLAINPEEYTQSEPARVTLTQTKGGAWIDSWGAGIIEISIKGITGVRGGTKSIDVGYQRFKELRNLFRSVYDASKDGETIGTDKLIKFYNHTDNEFFYCYPKPDGIELYRSKAKPHVYQYSISLYAIRQIGQSEKTTITIGNPAKESSKKDGKSATTTSTKTTTTGGVTSNTTLTQVYGSDADSYTTTTVKSKANADIISDAMTYCASLEPLIGGRQGKLSPITAYQCCSGISVQSTGTVSNVQEFKVSDVKDDDNILYKSSKFTSRVSVETYEMYKAIKEYSTEYLSETYCNLLDFTAAQRVIQAVAASKTYDSTLFENATIYRSRAYITKAMFNCIKVILIETMMMYHNLYKISEIDDCNQQLSLGFTMSQIQALIDNVVALNFYLQFTSSDMNMLYVKDLNDDLRHLEKVLTQIKTDIVTYL